MKILLVSEYGSASLDPAVTAMENRGVAFERLEILANSIDLSTIGKKRSIHKYITLTPIVNNIIDTLLSFNPDIIHVLGSRPSLLSVMIARRRFRKIPIVFERGAVGGVNWFSPLDRFLFSGKRISRILMPSRAMLNYWMGNPFLRNLARPERCLVRHYPIEQAEIPNTQEKLKLRKKFGLRMDSFLIGSVCQIRKVKNIHFLADVISNLKTSLPVEFVVIGAPQCDSNYLNEIRSVGGSRLKMLGHVPNARDVMGVFDLYVAPTKLPGEGFGLAFGEAMARGVPAITMNYGACAEICEHGVSGFSLPESKHVWRYYIESLIQDPRRREAISKAARQRIKGRFSPDFIAEQSMQIYKAIIAENRHMA